MASVLMSRVRSLARTAHTRRRLAQALALIPLPLAGLLTAQNATAKPKKSGQKLAEPKNTKHRRQKKRRRKQRAWFCLNDQSIRTERKAKKQRLLDQGATRGRCRGGCTPDDPSITCNGQCGEIANNCGDLVDCGACCTPECDAGQICCAGVCESWRNQTSFGSSANFSKPRGLAVAPNTLTAWAADYDNGPVTVWTRPDTTSVAWTEETTFGSRGEGDDQFKNVQGLWVAADGQMLWAADSGNNRISIWSRPDAVSTNWQFLEKFGTRGSADNQLSSPTGVAVSADLLTTWVTDTNNSWVKLWRRTDTSSPWVWWAKFGGAGAAADKLSLPRGIAISPDTLTAVVADTGNHRIAVWTRNDAASSAWANQAVFGSNGTAADQFKDPSGVALSADTLTVWVGDTGNNRVSIWTRPNVSSDDWENQTTFGTSGSGDSDLSNPWAVADPEDGPEIWVADSGNNRVSIWQLVCPA